MKPGAHLEQTANSTANTNATGRRLSNSAEHFQQSRFSGAVAADYTDSVTLLHRKTDVAQGPKLFFRGGFCGSSNPKRCGDRIVDYMTQAAPITPEVKQRVELAEVLHFDRVAGRIHQMMSAKVFSVLRKYQTPEKINSALMQNDTIIPGK